MEFMEMLNIIMENMAKKNKFKIFNKKKFYYFIIIINF